MNPISLKSIEEYPFKFSICTLVTNLEEYKEMASSFLNAGFSGIDCEYLFADNTLINHFDASAGINRFLRQAKGEYIIICHQDILLVYDKRDKLEKCIEEMNNIDKNWGVLGNAGFTNLYKISMVISEMNKKVHKHGILPSRVNTLDENFLVVKAFANLAVSSDLRGYHFYGTDMCIVAECLGFSSYVIDFHLLHKSSGKVDENFFLLKAKFIEKYRFFFRGRYFRTTITDFYISGSASRNWVREIGFVKEIYRTFHKYRYKWFNKI